MTRMTGTQERSKPSSARQLTLSLLAAVIITIATIALVTAKIGPGPDSEELHDRSGGHSEQVGDDSSGHGSG